MAEAPPGFLDDGSRTRTNLTIMRGKGDKNKDRRPDIWRRSFLSPLFANGSVSIKATANLIKIWGMGLVQLIAGPVCVAEDGMINAQFRGRRPVIQPLKPQNVGTSPVQAVLWGSVHLTLHSGAVKGGMGTSRIAFLISTQQLLSAPIYREELETPQPCRREVIPEKPAWKYESRQHWKLPW